jgi:hypothetical protein
MDGDGECKTLKVPNFIPRWHTLWVRLYVKPTAKTVLHLYWCETFSKILFLIFRRKGGAGGLLYDHFMTILWPKIPFLSTLTNHKYHICNFLQLLSPHPVSGHIKSLNESKNSLLLCTQIFFLEKYWNLAILWPKIPFLSALTYHKYHICNFLQLLSPHPVSGHIKP